MTVFLPGGCGYIGAHTAVALMEAGYDVVLGDNFSNSAPDVPDRIGAITGKKPRVYAADLSDPAAVRAIFRAEQIDSIIHFAGLKAVGESVTEPLRYYRNNLGCTLAILEAMAEFGVRDIIFSSSATVYGERTPAPFSEDAEVTDAANPYGRTKLMGERIIEDAARAHGFHAVLLRYFNPVGAHPSGLIGEAPVGIPNNLMPYITQVAEGLREKLTIFGNDYKTRDGTGLRDYLHVCDLAEGHVKAVAYAQSHPGVTALNLGTGRGTTVLELVEAFGRATGIEIPYVIGPRRPGDIDVILSDPSRGERELDWFARRSVEDMCRDAWNWQQKSKK